MWKYAITILILGSEISAEVDRDIGVEGEDEFA
jgi:hypothetical protein